MRSPIRVSTQELECMAEFVCHHLRPAGLAPSLCGWVVRWCSERKRNCPAPIVEPISRASADGDLLGPGLKFANEPSAGWGPPYLVDQCLQACGRIAAVMGSAARVGLCCGQERARSVLTVSVVVNTRRGIFNLLVHLMMMRRQVEVVAPEFGWCWWWESNPHLCRF
jgi:hypothetical protein